MASTDLPIRIVQISDIHCGTPSFQDSLMQAIIERIDQIDPDIVVVAGDLTTAGYEWEFEEAAGWLERIEHPKIVVPGNHDSRNVGYVHFQRLFGERFSRCRFGFDSFSRGRAAGRCRRGCRAR